MIKKAQSLFSFYLNLKVVKYVYGKACVCVCDIYEVSSFSSLVIIDRCAKKRQCEACNQQLTQRVYLIWVVWVSHTSYCQKMWGEVVVIDNRGFYCLIGTFL